MDLKRQDMLGEVFKVIGSRRRLATLEQITQGVSRTNIHEDINVSRNEVQCFISDFNDAGLITMENDQYKLTEKGKIIASTIIDLDEKFKKSERERVRGFFRKSTLSVEEIEELLEEVEEKNINN